MNTTEPSTVSSFQNYLMSPSSKMHVRFGRVILVGIFAAIAAFLLSGCAVVGGIFKAGVWVGVLAVVGLFVVIGGAAALLGRGR
ncbi:MAG: hypothetical protein ABI551_24420 [Polyangiaceae bacterium]